MIILDLDNCIADDKWRWHLIDQQNPDMHERFKAYHEASLSDELRNMDDLIHRSDLIILTARPLSYRSMTELWLKSKGVKFYRIIMRDDDDHRPSHIWKPWVAFNLIEDGWHIDHAYDDRLDVVEGYRAHDIPASVRKIHEPQEAIW